MDEGTMTRGVLEITQNSFNCQLMSNGSIGHELADFVNDKWDIRTYESYILEDTNCAVVDMAIKKWISIYDE